MGFNDNLKSLRQELNLSQAALAKSLNLERYIVSNWEQGRTEPNLADLKRLSDFFGISVDELINVNDNYVIPPKNEINQLEIKKAPIAEHSRLSELQENYIDEFKTLFSEETFWKYTKIYRAMDRDTRIFILGYICSYLQSVGMNVDVYLKK